MAAGQIPPPFAYDPGVTYAYHYFLMLFAAQMVRVGAVLPWTALDLARAISFGLAVFLAGFWTVRMTRSKVAGALAGIFIAFGSGTRWLIFLFPAKFLEELSKQVSLIGSGASSGANLLEAIMSNWRIEGAAKLPIPFAFTNGIVQPGVLAVHGPNGLMELAILFLMLLSWNCWRNWQAGILLSIVLSSLSLVGEASLLLILVGWVLITLITIIRKRSLRIYKRIWIWGCIIAGGVVLSLLEGGALLDILSKAISPVAKSYQTVGFVFQWPPTIVSSHLGVLPLLNWRTLIMALLEIGPVIFAVPFMIYYGIRSLRGGRWIEASLILGFALTIGSILINFEGSTGVRNTSRLYSFLTLSTIFFIPLIWRWIAKKKEWAHVLFGSLTLISLIGGLVLFAVQLPGLQMSVESTFLNELDARIMDRYWNKLDLKAMVFDSIPSRSVTVFGRAVNAGATWYELNPEWKSLVAHPDPYQLKKAGYDYIYIDEEYWSLENGKNQGLLNQSCVKPMESIKMWPGLIRKLMDISKCIP